MTSDTYELATTDDIELLRANLFQSMYLAQLLGDGLTYVHENRKLLGNWDHYGSIYHDISLIQNALGPFPPDLRGRWFNFKRCKKLVDKPAVPSELTPVKFPHSRACGPFCKGHGPECHENCPTCHGKSVDI